MRHDRALDGEEDHASGDSTSSLEADEQADVIGGAGELDPIRNKARSRRRPPGVGTVVDGAACIACFEPFLPGARTCVVIVGGVMPCTMHVDCTDPTGVDAPFDCTRRL